MLRQLLRGSVLAAANKHHMNSWAMLYVACCSRCGLRRVCRQRLQGCSRQVASRWHVADSTAAWRVDRRVVSSPAIGGNPSDDLSSGEPQGVVIQNPSNSEAQVLLTSTAMQQL